MVSLWYNYTRCLQYVVVSICACAGIITQCTVFIKSQLIMSIHSVVGMFFVPILAVLVALSESREFLGRLTQFQHQVRGNVYAISCNELVIENFYYDGTGPEVFAFVGKSPPNGPVRGSVGEYATVTFGSQTFMRFPRSRHTNTMLQIKLPDSYNINEANWLSIWCRAFSANFGHITFGNIRQQTQQICTRKPVYCQNLREDYDVCWRINSTTAATQESAEITLCSNNRPDNYFMGFGISKFPTTTSMFTADPTTFQLMLSVVYHKEQC